MITEVIPAPLLTGPLLQLGTAQHQLSHIDQDTYTFIMRYAHYYMLYREFYHIHDSSSTFRLFNIIISLFLHLVSFLSFQEIIQVQNIFKI